MGKKKINSNVLTISVVGLSVALLTVCSWISIPIGAVPITLQIFAVYIIAGLFDLKIGMTSVFTYLLLGAVGVPLFANFKSGIAVLQGPTGGYLIGYVLTALIIWSFKQIKFKKAFFLTLGMLVGLTVCYAFGTLWFYFVYLNQGDTKSIGYILSVCVIPFVIPDLVKIAVASVLVNRLKIPLEKIGYKFDGTGFAM